VIELIVDVKNCLQVTTSATATSIIFFLPSNRLLLMLMIVFMISQAYVGFARDMNAVIVVFRGTQENR